jgi:hypothetical protein
MINTLKAMDSASDRIYYSLKIPGARKYEGRDRSLPVYLGKIEAQKPG